MSESGDYDPGPWSGHNFSDARATYDKHVGRSYLAAVEENKTTKDVISEKLETQSKSPLVIVTDETGSMGQWPAVMFSKLPYLDHEAKDYLGPTTEISFAAIGDAYCSERYPLQARPFTTGEALADRLKELIIEGGGGGQIHETYELAALYYARNVSMPKAKKGVIIFVGDEEPYAEIPPDLARKYAHVSLEAPISTADVFKELSKKFSVYAILKPYGNDSSELMSHTSKQVYDTWCSLLGADHIAILPNAERVCDVIFGILAEEKGRFADFKTEIEDRQISKDGDRTKVDIVYKSLSTIHNPATSYKKTKHDASRHGASRLRISLDDDAEGGDLA